MGASAWLSKVFGTRIDVGVPNILGGSVTSPGVINKIVRVTIIPKSGDKSRIRDKFWNTIHHVMNGEVMNVVLFMMKQHNDLKMDKNQNLAYGPYIMALINAKTLLVMTCCIMLSLKYSLECCTSLNLFGFET